MDVEPLPKVTFLPEQLTMLVISNWTGETIDYEKNDQVSRLSKQDDCDGDLVVRLQLNF